MALSITDRQRPRALRPVRRGFTLVEMMVAALIVGVSLVGLVSAWTYMIGASITTDRRAAAYQCARLVMERARGNGFVLASQFDSATPLSTSSPTSGNSSSTWSSPFLLKNRFYTDELQEMEGGDDAETMPTPPSGARFAVRTTVGYSPDSSRPAGREDLRLMTLSVTVYLVNNQNQVEANPLAELQTCLSIGGA